MDIDQIITREEYNTMRDFSYDQFCMYVKRLIKLSVEESLKVLPHVITHLSSQAAFLKAKSEEFYKANKDLVKHKQVVAQEIMRVESENPGMDYDEVLKEAADSARRIISQIGKVTDFNPKELDRFDSHLGKL